MLIFILGVVCGALLMFAARLADKDLTRIVERYGDTGSVKSPKASVVMPEEENQVVAEMFPEEDLS